jgi:hypothetical protein
MKWFVLVVEDDIEPEVQGPFDTEVDRDNWAFRYRKERDPHKEDGIYALNVLPDGQPRTFAYPARFFEGN